MADDTLQTLLARIGERGAAPAIIAFTGERAEETSFADLAARARSLGRALLQRGIGPGAAVALVAPNSAAWIVAFWAIVATGATAVPIDVQTEDAELADRLGRANCRLVFTTAARAGRVGRDAIALDEELPSASEGSATFAARKPDDVAVILFTSGTTATPKAVPLTHGNLRSNIDAMQATGLAGAKDRALLPLPLHHAYPLTVGMMSGLACGTTIVLPAGVSGPEMITALLKGGVTILMGVPRLYSALLTGIRQRIAGRRPLARRAFALLLALGRRLRATFGKSPRFLFRPVHRQLAPSLRLLVSGGAKLDDEVEGDLAALGWDVMTGYGLTETSPILTFNAPGAARPGSAGRALSGVHLRIVNTDAEGVGEIEARGASVFGGYLGDEAATARAFTADRWFRTGDFGRIDDAGFLFIVARVSETIVLADGKKLFPEPVEAVYAEIPLVAEVALFSLKGALVALVVPDLDAVRAQGAVHLREAIRDALAERARTLPSHARLSGFALARDKLPRTQLGKIRRHLVPALYEAALAAPPALKPAELSPEDQKLLADETAAQVWDWLGRRYPTHGLGLDMNPEMDLGIDSLGWVDVTLALERELGVRLTEHEIGRIVTLRDLLREAVEARGRPAAAHETKAPALPVLGPGSYLLQDMLAALIRLLMRWLFKLEATGQENLPPAGYFLICPNHESYLDPFVVSAALPKGRHRRTWWAGWTGIMLATAARRFFSKIVQLLPVDQYRGGGASLDLAAAAFERGGAVVWFPEGGLSRDGELQRFQAGVGVLVEKHRVSVVPAAIAGSYEAWPYGGGFPGGFKSFHKIRVRFGAPIEADTLVAAGNGSAQGIADALRERIATLRTETRGRTT
ncbi:MAG TPA: AMP-binding protein [Stellaceae bacterium]|nr:AMP-binding protein [Stellaceae bacterium]